jgi:oligopeptide/dipeptide ABC transporter ATP-binding protein
MDRPRGERLIPIDGQPPDLTREIVGCAYRPRCSFAVERCAREAPRVEELTPGHASACFEKTRLERLLEKAS